MDRRLSHISQFAKRSAHTYIIIATALHCYNSVASSKVNQEIHIFSRKLEIYMKQNTHANTFVMEHDRKYFTNHDLHLNNMGKETIRRNHGKKTFLG